MKNKFMFIYVQAISNKRGWTFSTYLLLLSINIFIWLVLWDV